jgi:hypothetical protein
MEKPNDKPQYEPTSRVPTKARRRP